jgi:hypothetical protein
MSDPYRNARTGQGAVRESAVRESEVHEKDAEVREKSVGQLTTQVTSDLSELVRGEITLAKAEVRQEARQARRVAGVLGGAGIAAHTALLFGSLALLFLLDNAIPIGWAAFVVAVLYVLVATVLALVGRRELTAISGPAQTVETVKEDAQWFANRRK